MSVHSQKHLEEDEQEESAEQLPPGEIRVKSEPTTLMVIDTERIVNETGKSNIGGQFKAMNLSQMDNKVSGKLSCDNSYYSSCYIIFSLHFYIMFAAVL